MNESNFRSHELTFIKNPTVSILIPPNGTANTLFELLDSAIKQKYKNIEIICACYKDQVDMLNVARDFEKENRSVKVIEFDSATTLKEICKNLLLYCTGEYFIWLKSPYTFKKNGIQNFVQALDYLTEIVIAPPSSASFVINFLKDLSVCFKRTSLFDRNPDEFIKHYSVSWSNMLISTKFFNNFQYEFGLNGVFDFAFLTKIISSSSFFRTTKKTSTRKTIKKVKLSETEFTNELKYLTALFNTTKITTLQIANAINELITEQHLIKILINNFLYEFLTLYDSYDELRQKQIAAEFEKDLKELLDKHNLKYSDFNNFSNRFLKIFTS